MLTARNKKQGVIPSKRNPSPAASVGITARSRRRGRTGTAGRRRRGCTRRTARRGEERRPRPGLAAAAAEGSRPEEAALAAEVGGVLPGPPLDGDEEELEHLLGLHQVGRAAAAEAPPRRLLQHPPRALLHAPHEEEEHRQNPISRVPSARLPDPVGSEAVIGGGFALQTHLV